MSVPKVGPPGRQIQQNPVEMPVPWAKIVYIPPMSSPIRLKENFSIAQCCQPAPPAEITGYYSHDNVLRVHLKGCPNLAKPEPERLVSLSWDEIIDETPPFTPDADYAGLTEADLAVLAHHERYGLDYSLVVARKLNLPRTEAHERHAKLRSSGLLARVEPTMIQYRKGIVDGAWIKHRNHTYYDLTEKGRAYLRYHREPPGSGV